MSKPNEDYLICQYCQKRFEHLGSHLWHKHKVKAREYKAEFSLDYNQPLISQAIYEKKSKHWYENKEKYLKCGLENLKKYQFKKGHSNGKNYYSSQTIDRLKENSEKVLKEGGGVCPVCDMHYQHLASHLFNKHGLIKVT